MLLVDGVRELEVEAVPRGALLHQRQGLLLKQHLIMSECLSSHSPGPLSEEIKFQSIFLIYSYFFLLFFWVRMKKKLKKLVSLTGGLTRLNVLST